MRVTPSPLPEPDPEARAHSERLLARIRAAVEDAGGVLPFDRYMQMALYEPGLGYYSAGARRFGAGGDFTTAPLESALFSRTLAAQCAAILESLGGGDVLELGPGTGRMAAEVLAELERRAALPARYLLLEVSAALRAQQQASLERSVPHLLPRVQWLDGWPRVPVTGVVLANEVLDALPVKRFQTGREGPWELCVGVSGPALDWSLAPACEPLVAALAALEADLGAPLPPSYVSEWCPLLEGWFRGLATSLARGAALFLDYGYPRSEYYHPQRAMGTLICHYRHRAHDDPFFLPGLQDITAFVDFTAAAEAGTSAGLELLGFTTQAQFLMGAGLPSLLEAVQQQGPDAEAVNATAQAKRLLMPSGMGEAFKVLGLGRGLEAPLAGFGLADHSHRL